MNLNININDEMKQKIKNNNNNIYYIIFNILKIKNRDFNIWFIHESTILKIIQQYPDFYYFFNKENIKNIW